ncbi:MAG TPA: HAD family phosphatase [Syntrophales bacterium]|nr:HAD family phosphatase [Syntrophales bacterium]
MSTIKAVIFDWGGVLIENPTEGILQYSREVLGIGTGCMLAAYRKLIPYFQEGKITEEEFWKGVRRRTGAKGGMPDSLWLEAFEHSYVEKKDVFSVAHAIHGRGCRTGILSNTEKPARPIMERDSYRIFDPVVLSWQVGSAKPQRRIFEALIETLRLDPQEILLIDDVAANIAAAKDLGLQGLLFTDAKTLRKDLTGLLSEG